MERMMSSEEVSPDRGMRPRTFEDKRTFAQTTAEDIAIGILREIPGVKAVRRASRFDECFHTPYSGTVNYDLIVETEKGNIAVDVSMARPGTPAFQRKIDKLKDRQPIVIEHNEEGKVVGETPMPLVFIPISLKMKEEYSKYADKKEAPSVDEFLTGLPLREIEEMKLRIIKAMVDMLAFELSQYPSRFTVFEGPLDIFKNISGVKGTPKNEERPAPHRGEARPH